MGKFEIKLSAENQKAVALLNEQLIAEQQKAQAIVKEVNEKINGIVNSRHAFLSAIIGQVEGIDPAIKFRLSEDNSVLREIEEEENKVVNLK
jgi:hypothetical protein